MENKVIIDGIDVSGCEHYRAEIETKMPYGEYEIQKDKCHYSGIEIIQDCKGNKGCIYKQLQRAKAELKKYEDMAKKGLEEFKDVGGCWGCGLQLQLNQDIEDIKKLKAENEELQALLNNITVQSNNEITVLQTENEKILKLAKDNADANEYCLQELEKENAELKKENDILRQYRGSKQASYQNMNECWQISEKARRKLEKENNKLKSECEELTNSNERLRNMARKAGLGREKYRTALEDIRDIANEIVKEKVHNPDIDTVLVKINEVIGVE